MIAGGLSGTLLARSPLATAVLCVLIVAPGAAVSVPLATHQPRPPDLQTLVLLWSGAFIPLLAAASLVLARGYVRRSDGGTFF